MRRADHQLAWMLLGIAAIYLAVAAVMSTLPDPRRAGPVAGPAILAILISGLVACIVIGLRIRAYSRTGILLYFGGIAAFNLWNGIVVATSLTTRWWAPSPTQLSLRPQRGGRLHTAAGRGLADLAALSHPRHALDDLLGHPVRFSIAALLAAASKVEFSFVRDHVEVTDSMLSKQVSTLEQAGYVKVDKGFVGKRGRTWLSLTKGRPANVRTPYGRASRDRAKRRGRRRRPAALAFTSPLAGEVPAEGGGAPEA